MIEILKSIRLFFSLLLPYFISIIPRSSKVWLYGGRNGQFVDNTKYWFIWANKHEPSIKHIWISNDSKTILLLRSNDFMAFKPYSVRGFYYILRAKIVFYTHSASSIIRPIFLKSAIKFNFFHGIPLKTLRVQSTKVYAQQFGPNFNCKLYEKLYNYYYTKYVYSNYLVIPSKLFTQMFTDFSGKRLYLGYPRNIVFQLKKNELLNIIKLNSDHYQFYSEISKFSKRYIYMPTFREGNPDFVKEAFDDLKALNDLMIEQDAIFLLKLHPYTKTEIDFNQYSNLRIVNNQIDIYPFLPFTNCLISDYSSISMDYYFSNNPVIFYLFDIDQFERTSRVLDFNPTQLAERTTALNWETFLVHLRNIDQLPLLNDQPGKELFLSHIKPDLWQLSNKIKHKLLK